METCDWILKYVFDEFKNRHLLIDDIDAAFDFKCWDEISFGIRKILDNAQVD